LGLTGFGGVGVQNAGGAAEQDEAET